MYRIFFLNETTSEFLKGFPLCENLRWIKKSIVSQKTKQWLDTFAGKEPPIGLGFRGVSVARHFEVCHIMGSTSRLNLGI